MIFIKTEKFHGLVDALNAIEPCPVTGGYDRDAVAMVLAEVAEIYPCAIIDDVLEQEQRERTIAKAQSMEAA